MGNLLPVTFIIAATLLLNSVAAVAQAANLSLELNALEEVEGACRITLVASNNTGASIDKAVYETVVFGTDGSVLSLSLFDLQSLPEGRTRVRQFDLSRQSCSAVGRVLINGASSCSADGAELDTCVADLVVSSRVATVEMLD